MVYFLAKRSCFCPYGRTICRVIFAFVGSLVLLKITDLIAPLRVEETDEELGLDVSQHAEAL
jgi:Amt family ammonium transporter